MVALGGLAFLVSEVPLKALQKGFSPGEASCGRQKANLHGYLAHKEEPVRLCRIERLCVWGGAVFVAINEGAFQERISELVAGVPGGASLIHSSHDIQVLVLAQVRVGS